jgi:hypothetical protein
VFRCSPPNRPFSTRTTGHAEGGRRRRDRQPGGAGTDDAEIGSELLGHGVLADKFYGTLTRQGARHDVYTRAMEVTWGVRSHLADI